MEALLELKRYFESTITDDDATMAILATTELDEFPKDPRIIHTCMYHTVTKFPSTIWLKSFRFDTSGLYPFSEKLDQILFRLETSRILGTLNPVFEKYQVNTESLKKSLRKFEGENKAMLDEVGALFKEHLQKFSTSK